MDDYGRMLGRLICFLLRSYMKRDFKWTIEHPYWDSTSERLREIDGLCRVRQVDKSSIHKSIHGLLSELFDWQEERIIDEVKCPIYRFMVVALVNTSATGFSTAKGVTPIISKLQYCIRANIYRQIMDRNEEGDHMLSDDGGLTIIFSRYPAGVTKFNRGATWPSLKFPAYFPANPRLGNGRTRHCVKKVITLACSARRDLPENAISERYEALLVHCEFSKFWRFSWVQVVNNT